MTKTYLKGVGMLVGMIFGAGVFALPFALVQAGFFWGIFHFFLALALMIFFHFLYGEIAYFGGEKKRFTGYAEILLGKWAKRFAFLITIFTDFGSLLVYGVLGGIFLATIFNFSSFTLSLVFLIGGGILIFSHFEKIASLNFFLSLALVGLVVFLFFYALPHIQTSNFSFNGFFHRISDGNWFLPYGIWIFALAGFSALPEVRDIVSKSPIKVFRRIILVSLILCAVLYFIFIFTVIGLSGGKTTEDALGGLVNILGRPGILAGSVLGFLAVFTSFIALGADLKNIFHYDFRVPKFLAWLAVAVPPIALFLLGFKNFIEIIGVIGAVGLGFFGLLTILMARQLPNRQNDKKFLFFGWLSGSLIIAGIIATLIS
jgi:amino acid permease